MSIYNCQFKLYEVLQTDDACPLLRRLLDDNVNIKSINFKNTGHDIMLFIR